MNGPNSLAETWTSEPLGRVAAPVREQVADRLRAAITGLKLQPGQRLVERELMEQLGVSRTTIREAIRELSSEGLVTVVPQKGAVVSRPTRSESEDLYEVRGALESMIVLRFIERATDSEIELLQAAVAHYRSETEQHIDDMQVILTAKDGIYAVLIAGARSQPLRQLIEQIQARVHVLRATSLSRPGRAIEAVVEMEAIVAAIVKHDAPLATALYTAHIRRAARTALAAFDD
ncbi:GntR family transcriptional regulator [Arthrobacter ramosus]|uniref:GntR family transcriptional regulator n=1 Tax=Arthrobacter ramosus TaxID=1672 RepID=A0ABV5XVT6_ARTRM|nr:GntR family transcriptional regulator [Arthrobacter ramosus]